MNEEYKSFFKNTKAFQNETGSLNYSFEIINSSAFPFGGFDEFNNININKMLNITKLTMKKFRVIEEAYILKDDFEQFKSRNSITDFKKNNSTNLHSALYSLNPQIFKTSTSLIYKQWKKILDRYSIEDIYTTKFNILQDRAFSILKLMEEKVKDVDNLIFNISYTKNNAELFDTINNELKKGNYYESFNFLINFGNHELFKEFESISNDISDLVVSIRKDPKLKIFGKSLLNNMAEDFADYQLSREGKIISEDNKIVNLIDKKNSENIVNSIKLSKSQKYQECHYFKNGQILFKDNKGNYIQPESKQEAHLMMNLFSECIISYELRKSPTLSKIIIDKFKDENKIEQSLILISAIKENQQILKNGDFKFDPKLSIESTTDKIHAFVKKFKVKQLANSILSNKYKHLISEECYPIFETMFESNFTQTQMQQFIGKKIASCKNSDDFLVYLNSIYKSIFNFGPDKLDADLTKAASAKILFKDDDLCILKIDDFEDSKLLGTSNWCISRETTYFKQYAGNNNQYFIYDFSKEDTDVMSLIGITLYKDGSINAAHNKRDHSITDHNRTLELVDMIVLADLENLPNISNNPKYKDLLEENKEQKTTNRLNYGI